LATLRLETVLPEATADKSGSDDLHPTRQQQDQELLPHPRNIASAAFFHHSPIHRRLPCRPVVRRGAFQRRPVAARAQNSKRVLKPQRRSLPNRSAAPEHLRSQKIPVGQQYAPWHIRQTPPKDLYP